MGRPAFIRISVLSLCFFVFSVCTIGTAAAAIDPFRLKVSYGLRGEPVNRIFRVRVGFPRTFYVTVINTSSSSAVFYEQAASSGYSSIVFEISDEEGNSNVIRRKKDPNASGAVVSSYMNPGEAKVFEINLNDEEWDNAFRLYRKGARKLRVRAIYENEFKKIYSDYYEVIIVDPAEAPVKETGLKEKVPSALISK